MFKLKAATDEGAGTGADGDFVGVRNRLQALREVGGFTDGGFIRRQDMGGDD